jgi:hypothetical protein
MIDINDIPDDTEFNRMFKKKFLEAVSKGEEHFDFAVREDGKCFETSDIVKLKTDKVGNLNIVRR